MQRTQINPWTWQERFGFSQAWRVDAAQSLLFVSGQTALSAEGRLTAEGDFEGQARQVLENLRTVLEQGGASLGDIVKLTVYLTDIARVPEFSRVRGEFISGPPPASTVLEVSSLALPGMLIEVEATAVL